MKSWLRTARLLVSFGWEIGPGVFLGYVAVNVSALVAPLLIAVGLRPLIDGIVRANAGQARAGAFVVVAGLLPLVAAPAGYRWTTIRLRERAIMVLQRRVLDLASRAPRLEHFERPEFWDRLQLLRRSSFELTMGMTLAFVGPIMIAELAISAVLLADLRPELAALPLVAMPAAWITQQAERIRRAAELRTAEARRTMQHLFSLTAGVTAAMEVRIYGLRPDLLERHRRASTHVHRTTEWALFRSVLLNAGGWVIFATAYVVAIVLVLRDAGAGVTAGDVALALSLAAAMVAAASRLTELAGNALRARTAAGHYEWLEQHVVSASTGRQLPPERLTDGIALEQVTFAYAGATGARPALEAVSVRLPAGAVVAVVGENGAGKTTLVKLLSGMYEPTHGHVLVDGIDLADIDIEQWRLRMTAGFQDFMRFELVTREAVGVGDLPRIEDGQAVDSALARANATFVTALPSGAETPLGRSWTGGVELSGGEWQKLAIARSLLRGDPLLVILDEPTASLDSQTEHALFEQAASNARRRRESGRVTVLISHRFSTVRMADLIVVLDAGRVVEQGTHDDLMDLGGLYAELYDLQASAYR